MATIDKGISNKELAKQIRQMAAMLNDLLNEAKEKGLEVDVSINSYYKSMKTVTIGNIIEKL